MLDCYDGASHKPVKLALEKSQSGVHTDKDATGSPAVNVRDVLDETTGGKIAFVRIRKAGWAGAEWKGCFARSRNKQQI